MIAEPVSLLATLAALPGAASLAQSLQSAWRNYRWTVLPVRPDGNLTTPMWSHAKATRAIGKVDGVRRDFAVIPGIKVTFGDPRTLVLGVDGLWGQGDQRYPAECSENPVGVGTWVTEHHTARYATFSDGNGGYYTVENWPYTENVLHGHWEDHSPTLGVAFGDIETALQTAISNAQTFIGGLS